MAKGLVRLPPVQPSSEGRPQASLQRWGRACQPLQDPPLPQGEVHCYRCPPCFRTFRHSPQGITRWAQRPRTVGRAAVL